MLFQCQYQVSSTYRYGSLATAQASPGIPFKAVDQDIDPSTGLVATRRDVSGLATTYQYDTLGRTTSVRPSQDGWTAISYTPATSSAALAQTYIARQGNGGVSTLAESRTLFDALGRIRQEQERMPDGGTWSARTATYNALGWKTSVSELGSANATSYLNFDPFGRPETIRPPDGSAHDVTLSYGGTRTVSRTVKVATSYSMGTGTASETVATTNEIYDRQGRLVQVTEPNGTITEYEYDVGSRLKRGVTNVYTNGWLTAISGYTGTAPGQAAGVGITYHPNGMTKEIAHGNGVVVTQANDPNGIGRPASITAALGGTTLWTTGTYQYDGAGNIWKAGTAWYEYDSLSRLKTGTVFPNPLGTGTQQKQTYSFDDYGNLQSIATQLGVATPVIRATTASTSTNRLTGAVAYDSAGNLTSWNGAAYEYDAFDQMRHMTSGSEDWIYVYTADDERIWSYKPSINLSRWTLRGLDGKVLRDFTNNAGVWSVAEDYIYRNGLLFAGYLGTGQRRHFALDHLGTVRLVTNSGGNQTNYHVYYPFGEEATPFDLNADRMQYTGHERDLNSQSGTNPSGDDLDYMHARFYNSLPGRFWGVDPAGGNPYTPQSWNRYTYVMENPLKYVDPTGMETIDSCGGGGHSWGGRFGAGHSSFHGWAEGGRKNQW